MAPGRLMGASEVLPGAHVIDGATTVSVLLGGDQGADVDDPLALLARDPRPVVGVGGVREVLVLAELLADRVDQVLGAKPRARAGDLTLDGRLLGPADDVLDHRP